MTDLFRSVFQCVGRFWREGYNIVAGTKRPISGDEDSVNENKPKRFKKSDESQDLDKEEEKFAPQGRTPNRKRKILHELKKMNHISHPSRQNRKEEGPLRESEPHQQFPESIKWNYHSSRSNSRVSPSGCSTPVNSQDLHNKLMYDDLLKSILESNPSSRPSSRISSQEVLANSSGKIFRSNTPAVNNNLLKNVSSNDFSFNPWVEKINPQKNKSSLIRKSNLNFNFTTIDLTKDGDSDSADDFEIEYESIKKETPRVNSLAATVRSEPWTNPEFCKSIVEEFKKEVSLINEKIRQEGLNKKAIADINAAESSKLISERLKKLKLLKEFVLEEPEKRVPQLPELTNEMLDRVQKAWGARNPNQVLSEGFGLRITQRDLITLSQLNWLNDEVINFYMNLLMERNKLQKYPKVYAFNTFFYPRLVTGGHSALKRWTKKVDIFDHDLIAVPIHLGVHWCMAMIDFKKQAINYYDSMGHPNNKCLQSLLQYLIDESMDKKKVPFNTSKWNLNNVQNIPMQMNGSDCGMFACMFAEYLSRGADITFSQENMQYFRRKVAYEILTKQLLEFK